MLSTGWPCSRIPNTSLLSRYKTTSKDIVARNTKTSETEVQIDVSSTSAGDANHAAWRILKLLALGRDPDSPRR